MDYGAKRVGYAECDELHISVAPKAVFANDDSLLETLGERLRESSIEWLVVGVPYRVDDKENPIVAEIESFIDDVREKLKVNAIAFDEAYTSKKAVAAMIESGRKKKFRREKGNIDKFAAALILQNFLKEIE